MQSPSGKRVHLRHYRPGFAHSVHSMLPQQISRRNLRQVELIGLDSLLQPLVLLQPKVCLLDLSSASCTETSCDPTCHNTRTRQHNRKRLSPSLHRRRSCLCLSPFLPFSCLSYLFPGALHLPDVHRRRRVWSRVPPKIVVGSLCQCPLSHVRTQGLVSLVICQGNHFQRSR